VRRALAIAGVTVALLLVAGPAQAHNYLVSSTPAAGSTLTELPDAFVITTNDVLLDLSADNAGFALQVQDAEGRYYGDGCVTVAGPSMSADPVLGEAGRYTVTWQVVSTDGHTVSNRFDFTWQPPASFEPSIGSATAPKCGQKTTDTSATPSPVARDDEPSRAPDEGALSTVLWVGGAVLVVVIAVVATVLLVGRKKPE